MVQKKSGIIDKSKTQQPNKSSDETADWQLINDNKIGISIKMPADWENTITTSSDKSIIGMLQLGRKGTDRGINYVPYGIKGGGL